MTDMDVRGQWLADVGAGWVVEVGKAGGVWGRRMSEKNVWAAAKEPHGRRSNIHCYHAANTCILGGVDSRRLST